MSTSRRVILPVILSVSLLSFSACLKTRAQVREEPQVDQTEAGPGPGPEAPAHVQEVQHSSSVAIDEIKSEMTRMNGRLEDLERAQKQGATGAPTRDDMKKLEDRVIELEQAQADMIEVIKKLQNAPATPADANALLDKGKKQLESQDYEGAIASLSSYLKTPSPKKAEEATFLRGEAYFAQKEYKKAIVDYSKLTEKWTRSVHMPAALLKIGQSFEALGMKDDARAFFQELVEKYPKSPEAKRARSKVR